MNTTTTQSGNIETKARAFELIAPKGDWKAKIEKFVFVTQMSECCVTEADVVEAISFYTATETVVTPLKRGDVVIGFLFESVGYRGGPAW